MPCGVVPRVASLGEPHLIKPSLLIQLPQAVNLQGFLLLLRAFLSDKEKLIEKVTPHPSAAGCHLLPLEKAYGRSKPLPYNAAVYFGENP